MATVLRPSAILFSSGKQEDAKRDSRYSAARSIATGIVDLTFATLIFLPLNKIVDKTTRILFNDSKTVFYHQKEACSAWKSIFNRGSKIMFLPLISYLNFKYVKQIAGIFTKNDKQNSKK